MNKSFYDGQIDRWMEKKRYLEQEESCNSCNTTLGFNPQPYQISSQYVLAYGRYCMQKQHPKNHYIKIIMIISSFVLDNLANRMYNPSQTLSKNPEA